jgi:hypothetical protein
VVAVSSMSKLEFSRLEVRLPAEVRNPGGVERALPRPIRIGIPPGGLGQRALKSSPVRRELRRRRTGYGALIGTPAR